MTNYKATFERDGFLVLPKFFAEQRIDAVQAAVKAKIAARPRDVVVDVLDTNERKLLSSLTPEQIRTTRMKVNDLYLNTPAVRDIAIDTDLAKILSDCMGTPIALCNSLYFASFESRVGGLPGQVRAQARRSEHLTRVGK